MLIVPASLRKQWAQELADKFALRSVILDGKTHRELAKAGVTRPFASRDAVIITSYEYAARQSDALAAVPWDLVVFDEAHKLRNVYKAASTARAAQLSKALRSAPKLLLTATPLQNNLMELYGLVSVLDEHFFGAPDAFRAEFAGRSDAGRLAVLGERLKPISIRTLRRQVQRDGLIKYTNRLARTYDFTPSRLEAELYERLSAFLQRPDTVAIGANGRQLVTMTLRRILGSSSFAVAQTLQKIIARLEGRLIIASETLDDIDGIEAIAEDWREAGEGADADAVEDESDDDVAETDAEKLAAEIAELKDTLALASSIHANAKTDALISALPQVLDEIASRGGARKVVIFTESKRTQAFLRDALAANGFAGQIAILNGDNADPESKDIYRNWAEANAGTGRLSGSKTADMKAALVDAFRNDKTILIATESGAEGINLQFCSLLVNYDLPWNPQRVEQRIGRCHRYGQKIDVTVVNFMNRGNRAEARIVQLLEQKFNLFSGVFGSSDEVLGAIESGVDIERRILEIVQTCRKDTEIDAAFDALQLELKFDIDEAKTSARDRLLAEMDDKVVAQLKLRREGMGLQLDAFKRRLMMVARGLLPDARFHDDHPGRFDWDGATWTTEWPEADERGWRFFRMVEGDLASRLVEQAKSLEPPANAHIQFDPGAWSGKLSDVERLKGQSGWMQAACLRLQAPGHAEDHVILVGRNDAGAPIDPETLERMMDVPARASGSAALSEAERQALDATLQAACDAQGLAARERLDAFLDEETGKLEAWQADAELSFDTEIKRLDREAKAKAREVRTPGMVLERKIALKREAEAMKRQADAMKKAWYERKAELSAEVDRLLDETAEKLQVQPSIKPLFTLRWEVV